MSKVTAKRSQPHHQFHAAFDATEKERAALSADECAAINMDVQGLITVVLGALPKLAELRPEIQSTLPNIDLAQFDRIESYAYALAHAHSVYLAAATPKDTEKEGLVPLAARASKLRELLLTDARSLALRGMIDRARLRDLKGANGYLNVASDLGVLVRILRELPDEVASKSATDLGELDEAEQIFERITTAHAARRRPRRVASEVAGDRQRAYTLLVRAYDQAKRAVHFLRWHAGDADRIAPSLWVSRRVRAAPRDKGTTQAPPLTEASATTGEIVPTGRPAAGALTSFVATAASRQSANGPH